MKDIALSLWFLKNTLSFNNHPKKTKTTKEFSGNFQLNLRK